MLQTATRNNDPVTARAVQGLLRSVLEQECEALSRVARELPTNAFQLVNLLVNLTGRVIISGSGKSGLIARKMVATFSSLGIPSFFLHPHDALHGDLGMVQPGDLFIALSKSGSGSELLTIISALKSQRTITALISCSNGLLCKAVDIAVQLPFEKEACRLNLAPTSSSTITLAFGDALAVAVSSLKDFNPYDFARFHPAGALGAQLLLTVEAVMYRGNDNDLPLLKPTTPFQEFIVTISEKKMGLGVVIDEEKKVLGIITDGDLRRACKRGPDVFHALAHEVMTVGPKTVSPTCLAVDALRLMEQFNITSLVVLSGEKLIGILHIHEIIKAGIS